MPFDDDQHPRDEKGRFTVGGAGLKTWGKTQGGKLEGYSKGEGKVGRVEGRARDIEIPLARKSEHPGYSSGEYSVKDIVELPGRHLPNVFDMPRKRREELQTQITKNSVDLAKKEREASDAERQMHEAREARKLVQEDISSLTKKNAGIGPKNKEEAVAYGTRSMRVTETDDKKRLAALNEEDEKLKKEYNDAYKKFGTLREECLAFRKKEGELQAKARICGTAEALVYEVKNRGRLATDLSQSDNVLDSTLSLSHAKDGSFQLVLKGKSHDEKYPGEKEISFLLEPATMKETGSGMWKQIEEDKPMHWTITSQYPTDRRGKDHPAQKEDEGDLLDDRYDLKRAQNAHLKNFFEN